MEVTVNIDDPLAQSVQKQAALRGLSVDAFIEKMIAHNVQVPVTIKEKPTNTADALRDDDLAKYEFDLSAHRKLAGSTRQVNFT